MSSLESSPTRNSDPVSPGGAELPALDRTVLGYGCILPPLNAPEFPELEANLRARGVEYRRIDVATGGVMYLVDESQLSKLPSDGDGPYLPGDDGTGHGLSKIRQCYFDLMTRGASGG